MINSLYISTPQRLQCTVVRGIFGLLASERKVALFQPVSRSAGNMATLQKMLAAETPVIQCDAAQALTLEEVKALYAAGKQTEVVERVLAAYAAVEKNCTFALILACEQDPTATEEEKAFIRALNLELSKCLSSPILMVRNGAGKNMYEFVGEIQSYSLFFKEQGADLSAVIFDNADITLQEYESLQKLVTPFVLLAPRELGNEISANDGQKAALKSVILSENISALSPKRFEYNLVNSAKEHKMHIVLPEGAEERILRATDILLRSGVVSISLLGNADEIRKNAAALGIDASRLTVIQPDTSPNFEDYAATYQLLRQKKGVTIEQARAKMADSTYFGTMMVYKDHADGMVSGVINTTADTIRPSFEFIKTKAGASIVSSVFIMCLAKNIIIFADGAVNPKPTPQQLAEIAATSAETARMLGIEPRVAMLSYSSGASGKGEDVEKTIEATALAKALMDGTPVDGPLQFDSAVDPVVAAKKMPNSPVAGKANVFIFPDLNAGNNGYKIAQRLAGAVAIGPVLQGLNKPVNDLSRGSLVADIVNTIVITAIQAQAAKGLR